MQSFVSGIIVGVIVVQSAVFAPAIFTTLESGDAAKVIRKIFPTFFVLIATLGAVSLVVALNQSGPVAFGTAVGALSLVLPIVCRLLIPATNRARDEGRQARFDALHRLSVLMTLCVLVANIAVVFAT